jgi:SNF2 family DNA or RNA helicase
MLLNDNRGLYIYPENLSNSDRSFLKDYETYARLSREAFELTKEEDSDDALFSIVNYSNFKTTQRLASISLKNSFLGLVEKHVDSRPSVWESMFGSIKIKDDSVIIQKINYRSLLNKLEKLYNENNLSKIFTINYNKNDLIKYNKRKIWSKENMRIDTIEFKVFFAMEIVSLFIELARRFNYKPYAKLARLITEKTYVKNIQSLPLFKTPLTAETKKEITVDLLSYQEEFIELYPYIKKVLDLRGIILSFDQGLGKTLTSLVLAQNLKKEQVIIICPNTLKSVWANEIYDKFHAYRNNFELTKRKIYVEGDSTKRFDTYYPKETKYIIVNNESVNKISSYVRTDIKTAVIIDECHNFRYLNGQRFGFLYNLIKKLDNSKSTELDVLPMSGTPIKAKPSEIVPALMFIDRHFDEECAKIYSKCFDIDSTEASHILNQRFGLIVYRKLKANELSLPEKHIEKLEYSISNATPYLSSVVKEDVLKLYSEICTEMFKPIKKYAARYEELVKKYTTAPKKLTEEYLEYIRDTRIKGLEVAVHELTLQEFLNYGNQYVKPNIKDKNELKEFIEIETKYVKFRESAMGKAIGAIIPKRRAQMYIDIINENTSDILKYIEEAPKKVCLFSASLLVVKRLDEILTEKKIGHVTITGANSSERPLLLQKFREDDTVDVILGTNQTLSVGVTLTEANIMLIFGTPWRDSDFRQLCDRIHRIGQTDECYIYKVYLKSGTKNLSDRMDEILEWSKDMTDSYIDTLVENNGLST